MQHVTKPSHKASIALVMGYVLFVVVTHCQIRGGCMSTAKQQCAAAFHCWTPDGYPQLKRRVWWLNFLSGVVVVSAPMQQEKPGV